MRYFIVLSMLLALGACATTSRQESCPPGRQNLPSCPPIGAVEDPFINKLYQDRTWVAAKNLGFDPIELGKTADIPVQFAHTKYLGPTDHEAIDSLAVQYIKAGKKLHLRHLSEECRQLLDKAGDLVEVNRMEDPSYHVADDKLA